MFSKKRQKNILRQPKIYTAPVDREKKQMPSFFKKIIVVGVVLIGLIYLFLFSPVFKIRTINLMGQPSEDSLALLEKFKGDNIFRIHAGQLQTSLINDNPKFQNVSVSLGIPSTLRVIFTERNPEIVWQSGSQYYLVDEKDIAYQQVDAPPKDLILVVDNKNIPVNPPEQIANANFIDFLKTAKLKLSSELNFAVTKFEISETTFQVTASTDKNIQVILDTTKSISDQIDAAKQTYNADKNGVKQYLDVRVPGKVYYN